MNCIKKEIVGCDAHIAPQSKNKAVGLGLAPAVKKLFSFMLTITMLFSITAGIDLSAYAATAHTQQEAVNWANAQVGKSLDQDGVYGAQCVDLIRYYYIYLGASPVGGNGCDYATNALPSGWSRIKYYSGFTPQPGDVAVWTYASSAYGHVAIVTSANSSSMNVVEQNGSTHVTRSHSYNYSYGTFWGVIRPDFSHDTKAPVISNPYVSNVNGSSFTINCNLDDNVGVTRVWLNIYGPNGSSKGYAVSASNGAFTHTIYTSDYAGPGLYTVHIYAQDAAGNESSSGISNIQAITDNIAPTITNACITNISSSSFTVNCILNDNVGVTRVWLNIYGPEGTFKGYSVTATNGSFKHTIKTSDYAGSGKYAVHIYAFDEAGNESAYRIKEFIVEDHTHKYQSTVTKKATCTTSGTKSYTCTCGAKKTETIPATGHKSVSDKAVAATCTKAGKTAGSHCSVCNVVITAQKTVPATGHNYETIITKTTAKANGSIVKKCTICSATTKTTIYYPKTITLSKTSYVYNGKAQNPSVTVKDSKGKKIAASNYTVKYINNKNVGKATVTITFKGNYSGTVKKTFTIKPKTTTLSSVTAKSKGFTAKWKKEATQTTGYQIQYSTSSKFSSAKTVTISKNSTTSKAVSKLKAKKKYYVRIRTYKIVGKTKIYSDWSKSKAVTTKK